jgi:hypothetical protein
MRFYLRLIDRTLWTDPKEPIEYAEYPTEEEGFSFVAVYKKKYWFFWQRWFADENIKWYTSKPELFKFVSELTAERIENARLQDSTNKLKGQ